MTTLAHQDSADQPLDSRVQQLRQAAQNCRDLIKQNPRDAHTHFVLGVILAQLGEKADAINSLTRSLAVRPNEPDVLCNYAILLADQKRYKESLQAFRRALVLQPKNAEAHYHYGNALFEKGDFEEAMKAYKKSLDQNSNHVYALNNLGNVHKNFEQYEEAIDCYQRALQLESSFVLAHNNLGLTYTSVGKLADALACFQRAQILNPHDPEIMNNMGVALRLQGDFNSSCAWYRKALQLSPDYAEAWNNLGNVLKDLGELDEALQAYRSSMRLHDTPDKHHNYAMALLEAGQFEEGWAAYDFRWQSKQMSFSYREFKQPIWLGDAAAGRTLLIHAEQGFGDSLQFCRYVPMALQLGFKVVFEVQPALAQLMTSLANEVVIIRRGDPLPDFDCHCPLLSLPRAFKTKLDTIPSTSPYIKADPSLVRRWQSTLGPKSKLRVGIVWMGNPRLHSLDSAAADRRRSFDPVRLRPLLNLAFIDFFSLQKGTYTLPDDFVLHDFIKDCKDFSDTAALIETLDLVISVDTAVAHLAGALGKKVWLLNRYDTCWRWLLNRNDSPWYPSMEIFRQNKPGDWDGVLAKVCQELTVFAQQNEI